MTLHSVSVGIDHSNNSDMALDWAAGIATACDAELRVVHAWQLPLLAYAPDSMGPLPDRSTMRELAEDFGDKTVANAGIDDATVVVAEGSSADVMANECQGDRLVVLGRTGYGFRSLIGKVVAGLLGSTTRKVLHGAAGPVAVVVPEATWVEDPHVIVGVDGSPSSLAALQWAIDALPMGAQIDAVRFMIPWVSDPLVPVDASFTPTMLARAEDELRESVDEALASSSRPDRTVGCRVTTGAASWGLVRAASAADLLVVGHRDRSVLATKLLGSVADHAVRHARVPVVVVPEM